MPDVRPSLSNQLECDLIAEQLKKQGHDAKQIMQAAATDPNSRRIMADACNTVSGVLATGECRKRCFGDLRSARR